MRTNGSPKLCIGPYEGKACRNQNKATPMGTRCATCRWERHAWMNKTRARRLKRDQTAPRPSAYNKRAQVVRLERLAKQLNIQAMLNQRACEKEGQAEDAKMWWRVAAAAAEQVQALQGARQSLAAQQPKNVEPPPVLRDHMGVPVPTEKG